MDNLNVNDIFRKLIIRITTQHRAIYCYIMLSIWIFLVFGGMYKYNGMEDISIAVLKKTNNQYTRRFSQSIQPDIKKRRVINACNSPQTITAGSEGNIHGNYSLEGIIVVIRHGDRGPLTHIKNISSTNCSGNIDAEFSSYEAFLENITGSPFVYQFLGPFHGFPLMPSANCALGQLTRVGVSQLLTTGRLLRSLYIDRLGLLNSTNLDDVVIYSTRYRRTIQSGVALLYSLLTPEGLHNVVFKESQSMAFCFDDCACPAVEAYQKNFTGELNNRLISHPAVSQLVRSAASIVYEMLDKRLSADPHTLKDSLLTYVCHGAKLPCLEPIAYSPEVCLRTEQVTGLFAYIEWETRIFRHSVNHRKGCLLKAYGLLKNIVMYMLKIMSEKRPKIIIYSGHDKTITYLATALGIITDSTVYPFYASRFIMEVYKKNDVNNIAKSGLVNDYFFRVVYNGKDLTSLINFCKAVPYLSKKPKDGIGGRESSEKRRSSRTPTLCPIESIIRFLHDYYFLQFNVTNLKDACTLNS